MERAEPGLASRGGQVDRIVGVRVEPERGFDRPAAIPRRGARLAVTLPGDERDEARHEQRPQLVEAQIAPPLGRRLRELAEHHQLGERRHAARAPDRLPVSESVDEGRREMERQALVAAHGSCVRRTRRRIPIRSESHQLELLPRVPPKLPFDVETSSRRGSRRTASRDGPRTVVLHNSVGVWKSVVPTSPDECSAAQVSPRDIFGELDSNPVELARRNRAMCCSPKSRRARC